MFPVGDTSVLPAGDSNDGPQRFRRLGNVKLQQILQVVLNTGIMGAQGQENLAQLLPAFFHVADAEPLFRVGIGGNQDGADDVSRLFAGGSAHGPAHCLDDVNGAFAGFEERYGAQ